MKWCSRAFCSDDSEQKGSTLRVRATGDTEPARTVSDCVSFVGLVAEFCVSSVDVILGALVRVYMNSPGEYSESQVPLSATVLHPRRTQSNHIPTRCMPPPLPTHAPNLDREKALPPHCSCREYEQADPEALHLPHSGFFSSHF